VNVDNKTSNNKRYTLYAKWSLRFHVGDRSNAEKEHGRFCWWYVVVTVTVTIGD